MKTIEEQMKERAEAKIDAYKTCLKIVEDQIKNMNPQPHEVRMIKSAIEGCLLGSKEYLRGLEL